MKKLWDTIMNNKLLTLSLLILLATVIFAQGCASVSTLTSPDNKVWTYEGPKKVTMSWKKGDEEVKYSGLGQPWWKGLLGIFTGVASRAAQGGSETNINLSP